VIPKVKLYQPVNPGNLSQDTVFLEAIKKALSWKSFLNILILQALLP